eukprot:CAMPEP_0169091194 /NCGR_PEP_ID=MMETSP1015-20121227/16233_1 /TAXON_ID=342587 /ORGANISM="Karlodinium micrum, Strain CCMP2283" /LENGTH=299 /DNA_ID=CAMNT_0009151671 /DNA_START=96 /DNA_END=995 /DNA_ORIENTATION=-
MKTQKRILCYGDSLTIGFCAGGANYTPYPTALSEALTSLGLVCDVHVCGVCGLTAAEMASEASASVIHARTVCATEAGASVMQTDLCPPGKGLARVLEESGPFDLVILMAGTNDLLRMIGVQAIAHSVCQLHSMCHSMGVPTMMLAPPSHIKKPRAALMRLLRKWSKCVPQVTAFIDPEQFIPRRVIANWDADGIHFSPLGSRNLGIGLGPDVVQILGQCSPRSQLSLHASLQKQAPVSMKRHVMTTQAVSAVSVVPPVLAPMTVPSPCRTSTLAMRALPRNEGRRVTQVRAKVVRRPV